MKSEINLLHNNKPFLLKDIDKIKFYNTSFREYLGVYDSYIIGVYPFAINITDIFTNFKYELFHNGYKPSQSTGPFPLTEILNKSLNHHNDYRVKKIDVDPCDIYEFISGVRIHHGSSDTGYGPNNLKEMQNNIITFESTVKSVMRDNKIKNILEN